MQEEQWKDIEGYEGIYKISNYGRVASVFKKGLKIRKTRIDLNGKKTKEYININLRKDGKYKKYMVARLVAKHFLDISDIENHNISFKDGNTKNLYFENLEVKDKYLINRKMVDITYDGKTFKNINEFAKYYNLDAGTVYTRLKWNWTLDEIVKTPKDKVKNRCLFFKYHDKYYTVKELAEISGLKESTLLARIQTRKWSVEQAVETPRLRKVWNS